ncbi:MAG: CdaR family protein [Clostridia bacterium]|nr:CdaR family protein [Clostridia bacterium]
MNKAKLKAMSARLGKRVLHAATKGWPLKLLSLLVAVFLWSYVISTNPSITREKTVSDVDISVSGQAVLSGRGLALLTDIADIGKARVVIDAPQSSYSRVTGDNVRVELDLSSVRDEGTSDIMLRATTSYGTVKQIWPEYVTIEVEDQDQRYVPVNTVLTGGDADNYWYSVTRVNPSQIIVTGPQSVVQLLSSALVEVDVSGRTAPLTRIEDFALLDSNDVVLSETLTTSANSVSVALDIYPKKRLSISSDSQDVITGTPPSGYRVESVEISPDSITVAGEAELLDEVESLTIVPVDVSSARQSFTAIAKVQSITGIKNLSIEDITVYVSIVEESLVKRFSNIAVESVNAPDDCSVTLSAPRVDLRVTGPYTLVRGLTRGDVSVSVNLAGLTYGQYELPLEFTADNYPSIAGEITPETVSVTISRTTTSH